MKFLFLESFYGGSHKDFADGLVSHSSHTIDLETLPARFWKWRLRGAALHFFKRIPDPSGYDGLIVTDLMSLSDLKSLWYRRCPNSLVYFHENQLSYPLPTGKHLDFQIGLTDVTTALAADRAVFNSNYHREAFLDALPAFVARMPENRPRWVLDDIRRKSCVLYPGCHFSPGATEVNARQARLPLIIWNHRWEFDKCPEVFFRVMDRVLEMGGEFELALLGEGNRVSSKVFNAARTRYGPIIVQFDYVESREDYCDWLRKGDVVISTAIQENFGIAVIEAIRYGCFPLLPDRLSYPELIPRRFHSKCLYRTERELADMLCSLLRNRADYRAVRTEMVRWAAGFSWALVHDSFDEELERLTGI